MTASVLRWLCNVRIAKYRRNKRRSTAHHEAVSNTTSPAASVERHPPNSQSQSFFRRCGSRLPTSLIYCYLVTRGFQPWRPDADIGTVDCVLLTSTFHGSEAPLTHPPTEAPFQLFYPISKQVNSRVISCYRAKKTLGECATNKVKSRRVATLRRESVAES